MNIPKSEFPKTYYFFMHGLCHTIALEANKQFNLPLLIVSDYDDDYEGDILVHVANILPDGKIIDISGIYDNFEIFKDMLDNEFEVLEEFKFNICEKPTELLSTINKDLPIESFSLDKESSDYTIFKCFNYTISYFKHLLDYQFNI